MNDNLLIALLIAGCLIIFSTVMPMISERWLRRMEKVWHADVSVWSEREAHTYNKYTRHIHYLGVGILLLVYAIYELFIK